MTDAIRSVDLLDVFSELDRPWTPRIVATLGDQVLRAVRCEGAFEWHRHEREDELFFVVQGELELQFRDHSVDLRGGQLCVVPKGVEHRPVAKGCCYLLLIEPASTKQYGDATEPGSA